MLGIDAPTWRRVSPLLDAALDLPAHEREAWLAALPAAHDDLKALLRPLLAILANLTVHPPSVTAGVATPVTWTFAYANQPWPEPSCR